VFLEYPESIFLAEPYFGHHFVHQIFAYGLHFAVHAVFKLELIFPEGQFGSIGEETLNLHLDEQRVELAHHHILQKIWLELVQTREETHVGLGLLADGVDNAVIV
jgi:hypothetical protein